MESTIGVTCSGIMAHVAVIKVSIEERRALERVVARPSEAAGLVRRARVILLSASGVSGAEIALRLGALRGGMSFVDIDGGGAQVREATLGFGQVATIEVGDRR